MFLVSALVATLLAPNAASYFARSNGIFECLLSQCALISSTPPNMVTPPHAIGQYGRANNMGASGGPHTATLAASTGTPVHYEQAVREEDAA
jgi:hypothetical protein